MLGSKERERSRARRIMPWLNLLLVIALIAVGIWYLSGKVSLAEIGRALRYAKPLPILLGFLIVVTTLVLKAWRWQLTFAPAELRPPFSGAFWALMLGLYVNLIVPFLRLGEVARIYAINRETEAPMALAIGTLVVEKVLDLLMLVLTMAMIMPFVILPDAIGRPGPILWAIPLLALVALYVIAFQTEKITALLEAAAARLPQNWIQRPFQWMISGLQGLAALRSGRTSLILVGQSALIGLLSVLLPFVLFAAFDLPLTFVQAALIHVAVTIAITPPSTPGKLGVFNGIVVILLYGFGISDDAVVISYSIVYYLVAILPQILLGSVAVVKTDWHWQRSIEQQPIS